MKLVTFSQGDGPKTGVITPSGGGLVDLQAAAQYFADEQPQVLASTMAMLEAGEEAFDLARDLAKESESDGNSDSIIPLSEVTLMAPLGLGVAGGGDAEVTSTYPLAVLSRV